MATVFTDENPVTVQTAASYTALVNDSIIEVTSTASARTITLPQASAAVIGRTLIIKDTSGAAATNNITVATGSRSPDVDALAWQLSGRTTGTQACAAISAAALATCVASGTGVGKTLTASANGALTIDGVGVVNTNTVLIKNQANTVDNGIYTVTDAGSAGTPFILTRKTTFDQAAEVLPGYTALASAGTANNGLVYALAGGIDDQTTLTVNTNYGSVTLFSDGTNWRRVGSGVDDPLGIGDGGTGQVTANAAFNALAPTTTKGDIIAYSTVNARVAVGSNFAIIEADSAATPGVAWKTAAGGHRTLGAQRARELLGTGNLAEQAWIDFYTDAALEGFATQTGGTGATAASNLAGGVRSFTTGAVAGGLAGYYLNNYQLGSPTTDKFYARVRWKNSANGGGAAAAVLPFELRYGTGRVAVAVGVNGATSTTKYVLINCADSGTSPNVATSVLSTVSIETASYHIAEIYSDLTNMYLSVDGEAFVSLVVGAANSIVELQGRADNLVTTETDTMLVDYVGLWTLRQ